MLQKFTTHSTLTLVLLGLGLSAISCKLSGPSSGNTPEQMFRYLIEDPVPATITELQGAGDTWQGHTIYLRFKTTNAYLTKLVKFRNYQLVDCMEVKERLKLPEGWKTSLPYWTPDRVTQPECYKASGYQNQWTSNGNSVILRDRKTMTVFFHEIGI